MDDLDVLLIERACQRLQLRYAQHVDGGAASRVGELFTEDGEFTFEGRPPVVGRDAVTASFLKRELQDRQSRHLITNQWIDVIDQDTATGTCHWTVYNNDAWTDPLPMPLEGPMTIGQYDDDYCRTSEGWRTSSRRLSVVFRPITTET